MRATSASKFGGTGNMSQTSKSMKDASFKGGAPGAQKKKKDEDSDLELEDYQDLIEKMELDDAIDSVKKQIKKTQEIYKQNFLVQFFERTES